MMGRRGMVGRTARAMDLSTFRARRAMAVSGGSRERGDSDGDAQAQGHEQSARLLSCSGLWLDPPPHQETLTRR